MLQRCQETCLIDAKKYDQFVWTCLNVHKIFQKMWTKTWNYGQSFRVYLWTFKWTQKCSYNFPENVDKNMKLWTNISGLFMNIHEHSSEPRKCGQLFFKFGQYCPHVLENSMNIRVYAWTFKWTQKVFSRYLNGSWRCFGL